VEYIVTVASVGHKRDSWFAIDSLTGTKVQTLSVDSAPEVCPSNNINQMFIGRTGTSVISRTGSYSTEQSTVTINLSFHSVSWFTCII